VIPSPLTVPATTSLAVNRAGTGATAVYVGAAIASKVNGGWPAPLL